MPGEPPAGPHGGPPAARAAAGSAALRSPAAPGSPVGPPGSPVGPPGSPVAAPGSPVGATGSPVGRSAAPGNGEAVPPRKVRVPELDDEPEDEPAPGRGAALLLAGLAIVLLGVLPALFLIREAANDPVYTGLDGLSVPSWARLAHEDTYSGNEFCVGTCRLRERVIQSGRSTAETDAVYQTALRNAGWVPATGLHCPTGQPGVYTCWQRDQYVLDMWTRDASCATSQAGGPNPGPSLVVPSNEVEAVPSATPSTPPSRAGPVTAACPLSQVTVKVGNRADPLWHQ